MADWLKTVPKPIGILGFSDPFSVRVCISAMKAGFNIPKQIAILSCGNDPIICDCTPVPLSGINMGGIEEAEAAVNLLQALMNGATPPTSTVLIKPKWVTVRTSTDGLATSNPLVARAIDYMWAHLRENLSVDDIAEAIDCSRRSLQRAFQENLGRGVNAELIRRRLETCCTLLESTDLPIADIAPMIGFNSTSYLFSRFQRAFHMTPMEWRTDTKTTESLQMSPRS